MKNDSKMAIESKIIFIGDLIQCDNSADVDYLMIASFHISNQNVCSHRCDSEMKYSERVLQSNCLKGEERALSWMQECKNVGQAIL
jgi:hypothetical protein